MAEIQMKDHIVYLDDEDFELIGKFGWWKQGAGEMVYATSHISMHRLIMGLYKGDKRVVDHIDGNGLNNRRSNLRIVTQEQNCWNRRAHNNESPYKGVSKWVHSRKKPWRARMLVDGKNITIGYYATQEEAAMAYNEWAIRHHGEFAWLNEVPG